MEFIEDLSTGETRILKFFLPADTIRREKEKKLVELQSSAVLKGFRPGRVPKKFLEMRYGSRIWDDAFLDSAVDNLVKPHFEKSGDSPVSFVRIVLSKMANSEDNYTVLLGYNRKPDIPEIEYSNFSMERPIIDQSDENIDQRVNTVLRSNTELVEQAEDYRAEDGDTIIADYTMADDESEEDPEAVIGAKLGVGKRSNLGVVGEKLVGLARGEEFNVQIESGQSESDEGIRNSVISGIVQQIQKPVPIEWNDESALRHGYKDHADLISSLRNQIKVEIGKAMRVVAIERMRKTITDFLDFDVPEILVKIQLNPPTDEGGLENLEYAAEAKTFGERGFQEYRTILVKEVDDIENFDLNELEPEPLEFDSDTIESVKRGLRTILFLLSESKKNEIEATRQDVMNHMDLQSVSAETRNWVSEQFRQNDPQTKRLTELVINQKTIEYIIELADVIDKEVSIEDLYSEYHAVR